VEGKNLVEQVDEYLGNLYLPEKYLKWALEELEQLGKTKKQDNRLTAESIAKCIEGNKNKLDNLLNMKLNGMIDDEEYWGKRNDIIRENKDLQNKLVHNTENAGKWINLTRNTFNFVAYSRIWLKKGGKEERKKILIGLCSNPTLKDKELLISQQKHLEIIKVKLQFLRGLNGPDRTREN